MASISNYFIQYMLHNGSVGYNNVKELLQNASEQLNVEVPELNKLISNVNEQIGEHSFRIEIRACELTGEKTCVFINTCLDDISLVSSGHSPAELELFTEIVNALMTSDAKRITVIVCLNLSSHLKSAISKNLAEDIIERWNQNGYLVKRDGFVYLGPRCITEFEPYFRTRFRNKVTTCQLCTGIVYYGKICGTCNEVIHNHCFSRHSTKSNTCPICRKPWKEADGRMSDRFEAEHEESQESMEISY